MIPMTAIISVILVLILAACGGPAPASNGGQGESNANSGGTPDAAARAFFEAVFSGEGDVAPMLCSVNAAAAEQIREGMEALKSTLAAGNATVDMSGLNFETTSESGDTAQVRISGSLKVSIAGVDQETDYPEVTIPMRNEGGSWKICG